MKKGVGDSQYDVSAEVVKNAEGKRHLAVRISDLTDPYSGITLILTPHQAKKITGIIYRAACVMEGKGK